MTEKKVLGVTCQVPRDLAFGEIATAQIGVDVCVKYGESRSNSYRVIRAAHFVMDDDDKRQKTEVTTIVPKNEPNNLHRVQWMSCQYQTNATKSTSKKSLDWARVRHGQIRQYYKQKHSRRGEQIAKMLSHVNNSTMPTL